jgi:hypothetical protein
MHDQPGQLMSELNVSAEQLQRDAPLHGFVAREKAVPDRFMFR